MKSHPRLFCNVDTNSHSDSSSASDPIYPALVKYTHESNENDEKCFGIFTQNIHPVDRSRQKSDVWT